MMNGMPITMLNGQGLGCGCCQQSIRGLGEPVIMQNLKDKFVTTIKPITFYSKPPGDWFPLVNSSKTNPAGTKIGSITNFKEVSPTEIWLEGNLVFPGWFKYDPGAVSVRDKSNVELTQKQKEQILMEVIKTAPGGAAAPVVKDIAEGAIDTVKTGAGVISFLGKNLKWILIGGAVVGGYYVYKNYVKGNRRIKVGPASV